MEYVQELRFKKEKRARACKGEWEEEKQGRKEGKVERAEERGKREERRGRDKRREERREERRGSPVTSTQRLHCEPLLPSTAFQCKHCHPICDRVNWFFDVSRKVLIEKKKKRTRIFLSPRTPVYLLKKKNLADPKGLPFVPCQVTPPSLKFPSPRCYPRSRLFLGVMVVFFFFSRGLIFTC